MDWLYRLNKTREWNLVVRKTWDETDALFFSNGSIF